MNLQLIRNATMRINYGSRLILTDPFLGPKFSVESFAGISENPMVELPLLPQEVIEAVDLVLLSHLHVDHFDMMAQKMLDKNLPVYCQKGDELKVEAFDFLNVTAIDDSVKFDGIEIIRVDGQHGSGEWGERMGKVSGYVLRAEGEPTVYWCGDTIWTPVVEEMIKKYSPDIIITHSSGARFEGSDPIVMDDVQTVFVCKAAPEAKVIAVHMDTLDHGKIDRVGLATHAERNSIAADQLIIPADGEEILF